MKTALASLIVIVAGCAEPQPVVIHYDPVRAKASHECRYEAKKASPVAPSSLAGLGAAIGAAASQEAELYAMCMRLRGY